MFNIYIGWDSREGVAFDVCAHSIIRHATTPVNVVPLKHRELRKKGLFKRPWLIESDTGVPRDLIDNKPFSTEFSHSRFLVPALQEFKGWALFLDCDMIFTCDIKDLIAQLDNRYAVMLVKHNHRPKENSKMDDMPQLQYYRKNWSSFVLWNCSHPANAKLTSDTVNMMQGSDLHSFSWLHESLIGHIGFDWNWIEGISPAMEKPKVIHYTNGGPWFDNCRDVTFAEMWTQEYERWQREGDHGSIGKLPTTKYDIYYSQYNPKELR